MDAGGEDANGEHQGDQHQRLTTEGPGQPGPFHMAQHLLDFDPLTGKKVIMDYRDDGRDVRVITQQDLTPLLDRNRALANDEDYTRQGIKEDRWHYASIPEVLWPELLQKHGVDMKAKRMDWPRLFRVINEHYPYLKTTHKRHQ